MWPGVCWIRKFTAFMNMPKPMTANNYDKIVSQVTECVKSVAEQTIVDAAEEIRNGQNPDSSETVIDTAISCDGSWQRRSYSSLNGVVTAISMQTGKILDCEPMSRICKSCNLHEKDRVSNPASYDIWRATHNCLVNHRGSAGAMEVTGVKRIFERLYIYKYI